MWILWTMALLAVIMFLAGFLEPDKVKSHSENRAMVAGLYLLAVLLYTPNRIGAWCRRALKGMKRA